MGVEKRDYLVRKMLDGASALHQFFEEMLDPHIRPPKPLAKDLSRKYDLTPNQSKYLDQIAIRAERAQGIVFHLEKKFGININRTFQDPKSLYELAYRKNLKSGVKARSYGIAIGFTRQLFNKKSDGFTNAMYFDQLNIPASKTIQRIEQGLVTSINGLCFQSRSVESREKKIEKEKKKNGYSAEENLLKIIFRKKISQRHQAEQDYKRIVSHELRHIFDNIIGSNVLMGRFTETAAHAYAEKSKIGFLVDKKRITSDIEARIKGVVLPVENYLPKIYAEKEIQRRQEKLDRLNSDKEMLEKALEEMQVQLKSLPKKELVNLSYIFSTIQDEQLIHRLRLINKLLRTPVS